MKALLLILTLLLTACVASQSGTPPDGTIRPALDQFLSRGDIQVA
jgi:hypothetical protein